MTSAQPTMIAAAHGTRSQRGTAVVRELLELIRSMRPALEVREAWIDVRQPDLPTALAVSPGPSVIVPLLLSTGYHVRTDLPGAAAGRCDVAIAATLGPHDLVTDALVSRLVETEAYDPASSAPIVLVAAGSSDPDAGAQLRVACDLLAARLSRPVVPAVLTAGEPLLGPTIAHYGSGVDIANYLLAEGFFADRLARIGAEAGVRVIAGPLGAHPALAKLALARYDAGARDLAGSPGHVDCCGFPAR